MRNPTLALLAKGHSAPYGNSPSGTAYKRITRRGLLQYVNPDRRFRNDYIWPCERTTKTLKVELGMPKRAPTPDAD